MDLNTPIRSNTTPLSNPVFKSKLIFLNEWWLMKPQNQCKGLALAGIASMERERMFFSSVIVKRHEPNVVETQDGITIMFRGFINSSRTSQNGFPSDVCRRFLVGFPHNWKDYSAHSSGSECQYVDKVTSFDDSNASSHKKTTDETSKEVMEDEDNVNIGSLRLSQPQGDLINNGENGVSVVAAAKSRQSLMSVFEFDPIHEQSNVRSPLCPKKLEFEQLSSDRKQKKDIKKKIVVEGTSSLCRTVLKRSIAKKSHMMPKMDVKDEVKCFSCPVRRSPRLHNYKKK